MNVHKNVKNHTFYQISSILPTSWLNPHLQLTVNSIWKVLSFMLRFKCTGPPHLSRDSFWPSYHEQTLFTNYSQRKRQKNVVWRFSRTNPKITDKISFNYQVVYSNSPFVRRKRDDNMKININRSLAVSEWENETLEMTKVSRIDIAAFLCIASVNVF